MYWKPDFLIRTLLVLFSWLARISRRERRNLWRESEGSGMHLIGTLMLLLSIPLVTFFLPKGIGEHDSLVKCSRPRQLEKRSLSPRFRNLLQVPIPGEQESFHVTCEDQCLSHLPKDA